MNNYCLMMDVQPTTNPDTFRNFECMICGQIDQKGHIFLLGIDEGWRYCDQCNTDGKMKSEVLRYIREYNLIPSAHMWKCLEFIRFQYYEQNELKVFNGSIINGSNNVYYHNNTDEFYTVVSFLEEGKEITKIVSLQNLFGHNPELYENFIRCTDLYDSEVKISFDELDDSIKSRVKLSWILSQYPEHRLASFEK